MRGVHFSPRAFSAFIFVLVLLGFVVSIDKGSGSISRAWPVMMLVLMLSGSIAICQRMWRARGNSDELRRTEAQGLYGVLPGTLRRWLFP